MPAQLDRKGENITDEIPYVMRTSTVHNKNKTRNAYIVHMLQREGEVSKVSLLALHVVHANQWLSRFLWFCFCNHIDN